MRYLSIQKQNLFALTYVSELFSTRQAYSYSKSFACNRSHCMIFDWRQLEEIVAELLDQDGYTVELGRGTKDGGKDIVAMKKIPGCGLIMSIWQAKKLKPGKPVGIGTIRELADTRQELKASKGIIVTTTSLTRGALTRIEQDRYLLHKVDGEDLNTWIQQTRK